MINTINELEKIIKPSFLDPDITGIKVDDLDENNDFYYKKIISKCFPGKTERNRGELYNKI